MRRCASASACLLVDHAQRPDAEAQRFLAEHDVGGGAEIVGEGKMLVDGLDTQGVRARPGLRFSTFGVTDPDFAVIGRVDSAQDLDECAFAGTVVADEGHDFAGMEVDRKAVERLHAAEILGETDTMDQRFIFGHRPLPKSNATGGIRRKGAARRTPGCTGWLASPTRKDRRAGATRE